MRFRKIPQAMEYLQQAKTVMIADKATSTKLPHRKAKEVALEIGCGKGDFSIARALSREDVQYYALEKDASVLFKAVKKAGAFKLANLTFILGDAADLTQLFVANSVDKIYLNFSDPWPKVRHAKRRLTYYEKLKIYETILRRAGALELKTDSQLFFESSMEQLSQASWNIDQISLNLYQTDAFSEIKAYQTEYEKKFIARDNQIYYLRAYRK